MKKSLSTMSISEPKSVALLIDYLNQTPYPTEVNIAILDDSKSYPDRAYAKVDHHLGIHAPDLPQLAHEFREQYALLRRRYRQRRDAVGPNDGGVSGGMEELVFRILSITTCLLLVCPDHSSAWADRRRALLNDDDAVMEECALRKEMDFCNLLFTQHSKA